MTIKELAEFTGKTERTIRTWIKKAGDKIGVVPYEEISQGILHQYTIEEIESILNAGSMSKDAVSILMSNARKPKDIVMVESNPMIVMMDCLSKMQEQQQQFMNMVIDKLDIKENNQPKQLSLPETPGIEPRPYLNKLVREYSEANGLSFRTGWNDLYTEILYRCKINVKVRAKNEGIRPIDYLERENLLLTACSIVKSLI